MFAVIKAGGKQYRVAEDQVLKVEGVKGEPGTIVQLGDVIMLGGDTPQIGSPMVAGASVAAEISIMSAAARSSPSRSAAARIRGASAATGRTSS